MKKAAPLFVLTAGILWGCIGLFVRDMNQNGLYAMEIVALRSMVTCILMGIVILIYDRRLFRIRWKDIWCFIGTGICSIVFFNYCYFKSISLTSLSIAAVLLYTAPAIVMILSLVLFHEKMTGRKLISLIMTFAGCVLVTGVLTDSGNVTAFGILVGLGSGFGYALYSIFGRYCIMRGYHSMTITFYTFLFAVIGTMFTSDIPAIFEVTGKDIHTLLTGVSLGIFSTVIPYLLYTLGLLYVENGKASILASIEPVTATLLGVFLFHEALTVSGILGMIIVIVGLAICNKKTEQ